MEHLTHTTQETSAEAFALANSGEWEPAIKAVLKRTEQFPTRTGGKPGMSVLDLIKVLEPNRPSTMSNVAVTVSSSPAFKYIGRDEGSRSKVVGLASWDREASYKEPKVSKMRAEKALAVFLSGVKNWPLSVILNRVSEEHGKLQAT